MKIEIQASFYLYSYQETAPKQEPKAGESYRKVQKNKFSMITRSTSLFRLLVQVCSELDLDLFETKEVLLQKIQATEWKPGRSINGKVPQLGPAQPPGMVSACPALAGTGTSASIWQSSRLLRGISTAADVC